MKNKKNKKNIKYFILILLIFILFLTSCFAYFSIKKKAENIISIFDAYLEYHNSDTEVNAVINQNEKFENIIYKDTKDGPLKLDIYTPIRNKYKKSPVLIYIHGGAWQWGNKTIEENYKPFINSILEGGYTVIAIDYRLVSSSIKFPLPVEDCKDAVRWVYKNARNYNLDEKNIGLFGISAGAHLALLTAYSDNNSFIDDSSLSSFNDTVNYVVAIAPPISLDSSINKTDYAYIENFLGCSSSTSEFDQKIKASSPINYVKKEIPTTLLIHGKKDTFVPYSQSVNLMNKIEDIKGNCELVTLENGNHDLSSCTTLELLKMVSRIKDFISNNLKK